MTWSYYLSYVASVIRPLEADMSFNDFKASLEKGAPVNEGDVNDNNVMNKKQISEQVAKAEKILKEFVPVKEGGAR